MSADHRPDRRFRRPPEWISWTLGLVCLVDVPAMLISGFLVFDRATDTVSDMPPGCSFMDPCPATPQGTRRGIVLCLGAVLLWGATVRLLYRLLLACFDARAPRTTILRCSAELALVTGIALAALLAWTDGEQLVWPFLLTAFIGALSPSYLAVRHRYFDAVGTPAPR